MSEKSRNAFTLIEVVVVLFLVGLLTAIAVTRNTTNTETQVEAESLKTSLRFAQAKAMSDINPWGIVISPNNYQLIRQVSGVNQTPLKLPGRGSAAKNFPSGISAANGTGTITFDYRGRPYLNGALLAGTHTVSLAGDESVSFTITRQTGFIP